MADVGELLDGLERAAFMIGEHDADQQCVTTKRLLQRGGLDNALARHRDDRHIEALGLQESDWFGDAGVFNGGNDEVAACRAPALQRKSFDREVVTFCSAASKDNFLGVAAEEHGDLAASVFDGFLTRSAKGVSAGRIAKALLHKGEHSLLDAGSDRCGRVVVEIELSHASR